MVALVVGSTLVFAVAVAGRDSHTPMSCAGDAATYPIVCALHRKPFSINEKDQPARKEGKAQHSIAPTKHIIQQQHALNILIDTTQFILSTPSG